MKVLSSRYTAPPQHSEQPLVLSQRTSVPEQDSPILFQELCLGLAHDQSRIVLRRYFEHYSPDTSRWVEYAHSIPTTELIHWIMTHGQLQIVCSENTPERTAKESH
ncbi:hypothetical protein [Pseudomonas sp.]|uniref:hypothetical protein n=1 Tax=Pseudomonas sp. TaxID=306 RepID=UPI003D6DC53F